MYRITIDVGGTFTDRLVLDTSGALRQFKSYTTPADPWQGFLDAVTKAATGYGHPDLADSLAQVELIIRGTTLATNTFINKNGAMTGMTTTRDFRDIVEIRRGFKNVRTSMYNVFVPPCEPLALGRLRMEARERTTYTGEVITIGRTALSYLIAQLHDMVTGIWDVQGRTIGVPEGPTSMFGGESAARVGEAAWDQLRAPIVRVGAPFVPPPFSPDLEVLFVPDAAAIVAAVRRTLAPRSRAAIPTA